MASCTKCGGALITEARFCAACGYPVVRLPESTPAVPVEKPASADADPFAKTILPDFTLEGPDSAPRAPVSPLASSVMGPQEKAAAAYSPPHPTTAPLTPPPVAGAGHRPVPGASVAAQPAPSLAPGTLVLVYWANGQRYPGTVLQVAAHHVFVAFPNGMQQWIDARFVSVGG